MKTVLIMCGGKGERMGNICKPALRINGEKLVDRTIRLVREKYPGQEIWVVTNQPDAIVTNSRIWAVPSPVCISNHILYTVPLWSEYTYILLGDVLYSRELLDRIFNQKKLSIFEGNQKGHSERYSLSFNRSEWEYIIDILKKTAQRPGDGHGGLQNMTHTMNSNCIAWMGGFHGVIGYIYWHILQTSYVKNVTHYTGDKRVLDIDTWEDYDRRGVCWNV